MRSTIDLARHLGLEVVAEGVETEAAMTELRALGCHYAQGFLISPPLPAAELPRGAPPSRLTEASVGLRTGAYDWCMARLIRMDRTGHTTLAEWTAADEAAIEAARRRVPQQLDEGYYAVVTEGEGHARQVTVLPAGADLVILRRPIAGG